MRHNTAYNDTISSLTVVKENGWTNFFNVVSYIIKTDTSLVFYGSTRKEL